MPIPLCSLQLVQDRSRAEEYLNQSLPYLEDAQAPLREAAVRFIGEPQPLRSLFWQPGPTPRRCTGSEEQPCACQSPGCPVQGLGLPLPPLPTQGGLAAAFLTPTPLRYCSSPRSALMRGTRPGSRAGRAGCCAAGSMLGSGSSDDSLCLGLAVRPLRDQSEEKLAEVCHGE